LVHGQPASPASDLYSLGIVGWTALTGHLPFLDDDPGAVLLRQITDPIPPLGEAAAGTPSRLIRAIEALLEKDPAARPPDVESWAAAVQQRPEAARIAEPLRHWASGRDRMRPFQALVLTTIAMIGATLLSRTNSLSTITLGLGIRPVITLAAGLAVVHIGAALSSLRRAALDGYGVEDFRLALDRHLADRRSRGPRPATAMGRLVRVISLAGGLTFVALLAMLWAFQGGRDALPWEVRLFLWEHGAKLIQWGWLIFWTGLGINILLPARALPAVDLRFRLRHWFWRGELGSTWLGLGTAFLPGGAAAPSTLHRPAELVLGLEIDDLWKGLPETTRRGFGELPATTRALRLRIEELRRLLGKVDHPSLPSNRESIALRDHLQARMTAALEALERLRLAVLRLAGATDPSGELTEQLRGARALEADLLVELGAHPELRRVLRR
jgi:hypothetical protein